MKQLKTCTTIKWYKFWTRYVKIFLHSTNVDDMYRRVDALIHSVLETKFQNIASYVHGYQIFNSIYSAHTEEVAQQQSGYSNGNWCQVPPRQAAHAIFLPVNWEVNRHTMRHIGSMSCSFSRCLAKGWGIKRSVPFAWKNVTFTLHSKKGYGRNSKVWPLENNGDQDGTCRRINTIT